MNTEKSNTSRQNFKPLKDMIDMLSRTSISFTKEVQASDEYHEFNGEDKSEAAIGNSNERVDQSMEHTLSSSEGFKSNSPQG